MLSFQNVTKDYHLDPETTITPVRDVSLTVEKGEFIVIVGRSGTGKTTLLNLAAGLVKPNSGHVMVDGRDLGKMTDKEVSSVRCERMGFVFQFPSLLASLTVRENIGLPSIFVRENGRRNTGAMAGKLMDEMGLSGKQNVYPRQLSAGEQKRVVIARSLINHPQLILADEPTSDLDNRTEQEVMEILRHINSSGVTFLIVTHNLQLIQFASRAFKMENGALELISGMPEVETSFPRDAHPNGRHGLADQNGHEGEVAGKRGESRMQMNRGVVYFVKTAIVLAAMLVAAGSAGCGPNLDSLPVPTRTDAAPDGDPDRLALLKQSLSLNVRLYGIMTFEMAGTTVKFPTEFSLQAVPIEWMGEIFNGKLETGDMVESVHGGVSPDGDWLVTLLYSRQITRKAGGVGAATLFRVTLRNMPISKPANGQTSEAGIFEKAGADVQKHVEKIDFADGPLEEGKIVTTTNYISTDWKNTGKGQMPTLRLAFSKEAAIPAGSTPRPGMGMGQP